MIIFTGPEEIILKDDEVLVEVNTEGLENVEFIAKDNYKKVESTMPEKVGYEFDIVEMLEK